MRVHEQNIFHGRGEMRQGSIFKNSGNVRARA